MDLPLGALRSRHSVLAIEVADPQTDEVLVERADGDGRVSGRTPHFRIVHIDGDASLVGRYVPVEITAAVANSLQGRVSQLAR